MDTTDGKCDGRSVQLTYNVIVGVLDSGEHQHSDQRNRGRYWCQR